MSNDNNNGKFKSVWTKVFSGKAKTKKNPDPIIWQPVTLQEEAPNSILKATEENKKKVNQMKNMHSDLCEDTIISKETEINGSITSRVNLSVNGTVKGNIKSEANIRIMGSVEGDIIGKSIEIYDGNIIGNITSKTSVIISDQSEIQGDIVCERFDINGNLNGNVQVNTSATLGKNAVINGNLTSQNLSIQEGAIVNGTVKVNRKKEESIENGYRIKQPVIV